MKRQPKTRTSNAANRARLETPAALEPVLKLLPYQRRWVDDPSKLKIVVKARQIGFSFAATLRAVLRAVERKTTWIFLSKGERQSRLLMEKVQEHIQSCGIVAQAFESAFFEGTMTRQLEARFANGSVIYGLPANPDTARGYSGNVTLDEFAFHLDADKIYGALYPTVTRGFSLEVISTPNGRQGKFFELAKEAGLVDGDPLQGSRESGVGNRESLSGHAASSSLLPTPHSQLPSWSAHWCDIYKASAAGLEIDLAALRQGLDEEAWRQEFCCEFASGGAEWIPAELFERSVSAEATTDVGALLAAPWERGHPGRSPFPNGGAASGAPTSKTAVRTPPLQPDPEPRLFAGWDVARKRDLSVIWLLEPVGDVTWTRGVLEMRDTPTPDQLRRARALMPFVRRMEIDQGGMGLALAVLARRRMEESKVRLPDDEAVRQSFRSVRKSVNLLGQSRFDAEHDSKYGHADHWWAFCLAEAAADRAPAACHLADLADVLGSPVAGGLRTVLL